MQRAGESPAHETMKLARSQVGSALTEGSSPSPSTTDVQLVLAGRETVDERLDSVIAPVGDGPSVTAKDGNITVAVGGLHKTAAITILDPVIDACTIELQNAVTCAHLWVLDGQLIIRGMVVTGREACELPWRRKKDNEPASQSEIARELELVKALAIRGKIQTPKDFEATKLYIREDVK